MQRRIDPRQQGSRLSWLDTMFELVDAAAPPPLCWTEQSIAVPDEVLEVDMEAFIAAGGTPRVAALCAPPVGAFCAFPHTIAPAGPASSHDVTPLRVLG